MSDGGDGFCFPDFINMETYETEERSTIRRKEKKGRAKWRPRKPGTSTKRLADLCTYLPDY